MELLTERYKNKVLGTISCFDKVVLTGTMTQICYADGMSAYLYRNRVRVFDYAEFAEPYRNILRGNAENLARANGIKIHHINSPGIRKEDVVHAALEKLQKAGGKGEGEFKKIEGLFYIISAMERCPTYAPYFDKKKGWAYLKSDWSQCLHYYFYFIEKSLGLCYVRVPTWLPCRHAVCKSILTAITG